MWILKNLAGGALISGSSVSETKGLSCRESFKNNLKNNGKLLNMERKFLKTLALFKQLEFDVVII